MVAALVPAPANIPAIMAWDTSITESSSTETAVAAASASAASRLYFRPAFPARPAKNCLPNCTPSP